MPQKGKKKAHKPQTEGQEPTAPIQASASNSTPLPKQTQQVGKSSIYNGNLESAEANFHLVVKVFMKYRNAAGLAKVKEIEAVKEILSEKGNKGELNENETHLFRTIEIFEYDQELWQSIQALAAATQEFSKPPCSLTKRQYDKCVKSLVNIKATLNGPFVERQSSLAAFPDGRAWELVTGYFYNYTMSAVEHAAKNLDAVLHTRHHSEPHEEFWVATARRFKEVINANKKVLSREDLDQAGLRYRRDIYLSIVRAKQESQNSKSAESSKEVFDKLYEEIEKILDNFKTHVNHQLSTRSTASLAHIPVSRRTLKDY
ncbi:hypothetical protein JCM5353_004824 [Sporobolomyces roseus]